MKGRGKRLETRIGFAVDGEDFATTGAVMDAARERGYVWAPELLARRIRRKRVTTWAHLLSPERTLVGEARRRSAEKKRGEMAAICAELNARKAAAKLAAKREEEE